MNFARHYAFGLNLNAALRKNHTVIAPGNHHAVAFDLAFDLRVSPRIKVCSEMMLPFTLPSIRKVPVSCSVPSIVTPWSMKPVHSFAAAVR